MRLYTTCHCGHTIRLRGSYPTADEVRRQLGDFVTLHCPHCGQTVHLPYTWIYPVSWGLWGAIGILSAFILGSVAVMALLQNAGADIGAVIWIPIVALAFYVQIAKLETDTIDRFEHSRSMSPSPHLTPEVAATWSDQALLEWYDICEPEDLDHANLCERRVYYATILNYEEAPRYMEWFYFYEYNYNPLPDDGTELYLSLMAVGATRHAAIVLEAQEIYLQHKAEVEECVSSVMHDGYQLLLSMNLFERQDDALAFAYLSEPLMPLVAQYIRQHIPQLEGTNTENNQLIL